MPKSANTQIAVIGIDIGKNSFDVVGHDKRGSIVLRQKWSRGQIEARRGLPTCRPVSSAWRHASVPSLPCWRSSCWAPRWIILIEKRCPGEPETPQR